MALTLREWRLAKELSKKDMADAIGVSIPTYSAIEDDVDKLTVGGVKKACERLGVSLTDIAIFGEPNGEGE